MIKYFTIEDLLKHYLQKKFHILKNSIEFFRIPLFAFIVHKLLESYAEKAYFPYPIEILFLNLCGSSISHLFVLIFI